jgi:hypothetical protein
VAAIAGLVTKVDVPRLVAWGNGQVNLLWTDDAEIRLRRSTDGGRSFLDEVGVADLASATSRIGPDIAYEAGSGRLTALWQDLSPGATSGQVNSLVETRYMEPL